MRLELLSQGLDVNLGVFEYFFDGASCGISVVAALVFAWIQQDFEENGRFDRGSLIDVGNLGQGSDGGPGGFGVFLLVKVVRGHVEGGATAR